MILRIKYDNSTLKLMSIFERMTRAKIKDCFELYETIFFVVEQGYLMKALGNKAENVARLRQTLNRKIKIVEFAPELVAFIRNLANPLKVEVAIEGDIVTLLSDDVKVKGLLIGKGGQNLRAMEQVVNRYFKVEEIKVAK